MRFGVCTKFENLPFVAAAGYDYFEGNLNKLAAMSEEESEAARAALQASGLAMETTACFFGSADRLTGEEVDFEAIAAYADRALKRAAAFGVKVAVLGSGGARKIPEGFPREKAEEQFVRVIRICGDAAQKYGIKIALEPLNRNETNLMNTLSEGLALCERADHPAVGMLADFYHMYMVDDDLATLQAIGDRLFHVHIARPNEDRAAPSMADEAVLRQWSAALKQSGYNGRISLECKFIPSVEQGLTDMNSVKGLFR
ncbi:MAG: sugar phosphate isomerase/epimerase [Clostridia bacterium]|nr:sugar phosphate isomerase/epimerase [Clostridia bacterium]